MGRSGGGQQDPSWTNWFGVPGGGRQAATGRVPQAGIEELVGMALLRLRSGMDPKSEIARLASRCSDGRGQRQALSVLQPMLVDVVAEAWARGWEPVDLLRYTAKRLTTSQRQFTAELAAMQLSQYAPATLPPTWQGQLTDAEASVWWPPDQSILAIRAERAGWEMLLTDAVTVLHLVGSLPKIERLGPLPGQSQLPRPGGQLAADPRILGRVRRLLAQAESTNFESEADSFTEAAQSLMARHRIDRAMIEAAQRDTDGDGAGNPEVHAQRLGIENPYEAPKALLLDEVARANRCRMVWNREYGFGTVVGHAADRAAVELLFTSLLVQATRAMTAAGSRARRNGSSRTRSFRASFLTAFATRIGQRLSQVAETEETSAAAQAGGAALVPLLAARTAAVEAAVEDMFPALESRSVSAPTDGEGWRAGVSAADQAQLGASHSLGRGRTPTTSDAVS